MKSSKKQIEYCATLRTSSRITYNAIGSVFCPVLNESVVFNSVGYRHLIFKPDGTPRDVIEVIYKLTLIPLAVPVIKNAIGLDQVREVAVRESRTKGSPYRKGKTYALVARVGKKNPVNVRVLIFKPDDNGMPYFYSIMKD